MSKPKKSNGKSKKNPNIYIIIGIVLLLVFAGYKFAVPQNGNTAGADAGANIVEGTLDGIDLKITKADITEKATFYSYKEAENYMEVIALKASDGSVRTALNTCQICYDSGQGYYKQVDNTLVCQNCGNIFGVDDVEVVRGGCNPIPILKENKTEDDQFITISGEFLADNSSYFERWSR